MKISVVLLTRNEEENIERCLNSVSSFADEIVIFDENSEDKTRDIAKRFGARVYKVGHEDNFHINKKKALEKASGEWILQLDADEVVTPILAEEIKKVTRLSGIELIKRRPKDEKKWKLFRRHQQILQERDGKYGTDSGEIVAFFVPRRTIFLGKPIVHGGAYPDGVIRLVKNGKAWFPAKSVHEQIHIEGKVAWLFSDLDHYAAQTLDKYITRANRYTDLKAIEYKKTKVSKNFITFVYFSTIKPLSVFANLYIRHKGYLDGTRGFLWAAFSSMHFPIQYYKYWISKV